MKRLAQLGVAATVAASSLGCLGFERESTLTSPSAGGMSALSGSWSSSSGTGLPSPSSCSDFRWNVTEQTSNSASGSFSATCAAGVRLSGTAEGTLGDSRINWSAQGVATDEAGSSCSFSLTGTAEILQDSVRVPYSGSSCMGSVSGTEILQRG